MADKNIQMTQRNASNTGWDNLYPITKASNVQVTPISGLAGTDVQTVLQNLFQFANDGKTAVANAITAKGVSASPSETFASLAAKIGQISTGKKWASGTVSRSATNNNVYNKWDNSQAMYNYTVTVTGLDFTPSLIFVFEKTPTGASAMFAVYYRDWNDDTRDAAVWGSGFYKIPDTDVGFGTFKLPVGNNSSPNTYNWIAFE
jgi:hypothetical protein